VTTTQRLHGTEAAYKAGCRCEPCVKRRRRRSKLRRVELRGMSAKVDAAAAWDHIDGLVAEGWSLSLIARAAKVEKRTVVERLPGIQRERAGRILAVDRETLYGLARDFQHVPAVGAVRRIQALQAMGWPLNTIGAYPHMAGRILRREGSVTSAGKWRAIAATYDRLAMTRGPSERARQAARKAGWPLPLCWDDDDIDDPAALPERRRTKADDRADEHAERRQITAALTARGFTGPQIAMELGVTIRTVERLRSEAKMIGETA
jgi:hypothetical protein